MALTTRVQDVWPLGGMTHLRLLFRWYHVGERLDSLQITHRNL